MKTPTSTLRARLSRPEILLAPGVYDALSAVVAAASGAEALYLSGASIAYTRAARPDIGLVDMSEAADVLSLIRDRVDLPIIADADNGFGNALNVQRTVRAFEKAGANAIQLEDQTLPKRCGHLAGKSLVSTAEMVGKVQAALDARRDEDTLIVARTDAIAVEGIDRAFDRAEAYVEAGADVLFVEAVRGQDEMRRTVATFGARVPLLVNMVEGGQTPMMSAAELGAIGFRIVIFPGGAVRAIARTLADYYASLVAHGTNTPFRNQMLDFDGINAVVGTEAMLAAGRRFDADATAAGTLATTLPKKTGSAA